jgi:hypothetical protein
LKKMAEKEEVDAAVAAGSATLKRFAPLGKMFPRAAADRGRLRSKASAATSGVTQCADNSRWYSVTW